MLQEMGRDQDAEHAFLRAIDDGDHLAHEPYGLLLLAQGRLDEAREQLKQAAAHGSANARAALVSLNQRSV
jgi:hypothetical protein